MDLRRSIPFNQLAPLLAEPGASFISLQKGSSEPGLIDWMEDCEDFADTAALIAALDLVITVDTAVAHVAGALGRPVWVLNRYDRCWRWLWNRTDTPWYPSVRCLLNPPPEFVTMSLWTWRLPFAATGRCLTRNEAEFIPILQCRLN